MRRDSSLTPHAADCRGWTLAFAALIVCLWHGARGGDAPPRTAAPAGPTAQKSAGDAKSAKPEPVFRRDDTRPKHDDARAAELGIKRYESKHLLLYTDLDPDVARTLPPLMDAAYLALEDYFGPLPSNRAGTTFQMTGYVMVDAERFRTAGMLPQKAADLLVHGIYRGAEFWMHSQEYEYYRRHLLVHEGTHCFMSFLSGPRLPDWYIEGMAEYFGTHHLAADGQATFGVMPVDPEDYVGFGRVEMLHEDIDAGRLRRIENVLALGSNDYIQSRREPYAWSWAFCKFLDANPHSQARFRELRLHLANPGFAELFTQLFTADAHDLELEWELFVRNIVYGFDVERAAIDFRTAVPLQSGHVSRTEIRADAGWQATGVHVEAGAAYQLSATGEVTLALEPRPWISQPQGVSIRYAGGRPIGRVLAAVRADAAGLDDTNGWQEFDVGRSTELSPADSGHLFVRVNDDWNSLADNSGAYSIEISRP